MSDDDIFAGIVTRSRMRMRAMVAAVEKSKPIGLRAHRATGLPYRLVLSRSTTPGVMWQVTSFDDVGPMGHREYNHLADGPPIDNALIEFTNLVVEYPVGVILPRDPDVLPNVDGAQWMRRETNGWTLGSLEMLLD